MARVMIVDDDRSTVEMLAKAMAVFGHEALTAFGGQEALARAAAECPDVMLLDLMMPGIDGYETLRRLRAQPGGDGLPVIVVTASAELDVEERVTAAGGDACLRKPVNLGALNDLVERHARRAVPQSSG